MASTERPKPPIEILQELENKPKQQKDIETRVKTRDGKVYTETIKTDGSIVQKLQGTEQIPQYLSHPETRNEADTIKSDTKTSKKKSKGGTNVRGAWCIKPLSLSCELLTYLQCNIDFAKFEEKELESNGFSRCVDIRSVPNHIYYEGYFHGSPISSGCIKSINPRLGDNMMKPAAPISLRAFINAFKQINSEWINIAIKDTFIEELNLSHNLFYDFAVQIHFGDHIDAKHVGWHMDSINSILHLAVSLRGKRALHYKPNADMITMDGNNDNDNDDKQEEEKKEKEVKVKWQNEGDAYLSSPYAFIHGVEYPNISWNDRIIAIQCRWLFDMNQYNLIIDRHEDWMKGMNQITNILKETQVKIPTLTQVMEMENHIKQNEISEDIDGNPKHEDMNGNKNKITCIIL